MRTPPPLADAPRYPVIAGTALLAIGVTIAYFAKVDISPLFASPMIRRGEIWRLVTCMLPHGDFLHIFFDVYWFWIFGALIEESFGHLRTALLVILFAFGSSAWEFAFLDGGIGLSGVVYGFFGFLWMLARHDSEFHDVIDRRTIELFIGWFFFCVIATYFKFMMIANLAHGIGALLGIFVGLAVTREDHRSLAVIGLAATLLLGLWGATAGRPHINLSSDGGMEEARWGYEALVAKNNATAIRWFRDAVTYQPKNVTYLYDLGIAYERSGDMQNAIAAYHKAAKFGDSLTQFRLGNWYETGDKGFPKDPQQALYWYRKVEEQSNPEALNNVAWAYATSTDPIIRNPKQALECARRVAAIERNHPDPSHLDTLAEALWLNGQADEAVKTETQAISLASPEEKSEFEPQLKKYENALAGNSKRTGS